MFHEAVTNTNVLFYLMAGVGIIGILAKLMNQITLRRMVRAAKNMSKSTHKLVKLVRAKYEHACMMYERVENVEAFVEKYIYEFRGIILRIHTWRQLEIQSIWFVGILAGYGAFVQFFMEGFGERVYQYVAVGLAEMLLLYVVSQISDEEYKRNAAKNYMVDYLQNMSPKKAKRGRQRDRERTEAVVADGLIKENRTSNAKNSQVGVRNGVKTSSDVMGVRENVDVKPMEIQKSSQPIERESENEKEGAVFTSESVQEGSNFGETMEYQERNIQKNIGVKRRQRFQTEQARAEKKKLFEKTESEERFEEVVPAGEKQNLPAQVKQQTEYEEEQPVLREEAIRQILEEFLA